jgi:hypothetical protein
MKKSPLALLLLALSPLSYCEASTEKSAPGNSSSGKTHTVGFGFDWANYRSDLGLENSDARGYGRLYYSYQFTPVWAINLDHTGGNSSDISFYEYDPTISRRSEYTANIISAKRSFTLSPRWQFYGQLGANL